MNDSVIFSNEYLKLTARYKEIYIETLKKGFSFENLNKILSTYPQIEITDFNALKASINNAPIPPVKIGKLKERITIDFIENDLKAYITYNISNEELKPENREKILHETIAKLGETGIVFGIKRELFTQELVIGKRYLIAEGIPPMNGNDSIIKMYQLQETSPKVGVDGKVDFYELKLINKVVSGDWLGERTEATVGYPGKSVKNEPIKAIDGKTVPLLFDRNSVVEIPGNSKTTLYARINGAVNYDNGKIAVSNHLEAEGDVDFKTGNINFDGYLTIKGTVTDGFTATATKDIEINGPMGLGNVKSIISKEGSIYIKGGISSKGKSEIRAKKNVFTKFVDNSTLICGQTAHIGYYCINSNISAKEIVIDSTVGQIIGGNIKAEVKITTPVLGSEHEKRTIVEITGFDRQYLQEELESIIQRTDCLKSEQQKVKLALSGFEEKAGQLNQYQLTEYNNNYDRFLKIKEEMKELEEKRKNIIDYLKAYGEGEVCVTKKIFPNCLIIMKNNRMEISSSLLATSLFIQDDEIKSK